MVSTAIILLHTITGHNMRFTPYTNQTSVLVKTIKIMAMLKSPTLFDFHALITWGIKVILLRKAPTWPTTSIHVIKVTNLVRANVLISTR